MSRILRCGRVPVESIACLIGMLCCVSVGCSSDSKHSGGSAGAAGGGGSAGAAGGGGRAAGTDAGTSDPLGEACSKDSDCGGKFSCDREIAQLATVSGAPEGQIDLSLFPGGSCTPIPLSAYDSTGAGKSCDPAMPAGSQGCGADGVCLAETVNNKQLVGCRRACEPSATESGCTRAGYTCDFGVHACIEACRSDTECRLSLLDTDGDGQPDTASYNRNSQATCNAKTGRCEHPAGPAADGASCMHDDDCSSDGNCLTADSTVAGQPFPGGYCSKTGCDVDGRGCEDGAVCEPLRPWLDAAESNPLCFTRCTVGAEPAAQQTGPKGHGAGCRDGYRCHYNGGMGAESGVCVGGNYNTISANNTGAACKADTDCYSAFGTGRCLTYGLPNSASSPGICVLLDCNVPGLPKDICGAGNECVASSGDQANCMHDCSQATECPSGFACYDDDGDKGTSKICYPICGADADCRISEHCKLFTGQMYGQCGLQ